jgi:hypothetical protein
LTITNTKTKDNEVTLDIHKEIAHLTLDIVTRCVFKTGMTTDEHDKEIIHQDVTANLEDLEERTFNMIGIIPIINQLPFSSKRRIDQSKKNVKHIINDRKKTLLNLHAKVSFLSFSQLLIIEKGTDIWINLYILH